MTLVVVFGFLKPVLTTFPEVLKSAKQHSSDAENVPQMSQISAKNWHSRRIENWHSTRKNYAPTLIAVPTVNWPKSFSYVLSLTPQSLFLWILNF